MPGEAHQAVANLGGLTIVTDAHTTAVSTLMHLERLLDDVRCRARKGGESRAGEGGRKSIQLLPRLQSAIM